VGAEVVKGEKKGSLREDKMLNDLGSSKEKKEETQQAWYNTKDFGPLGKQGVLRWKSMGKERGWWGKREGKRNKSCLLVKFER